MTDPGNPHNTRNGPSRMAEGIALQRFAESRLPEDERIFCDPYAIHFIDPVMLTWAKEHPAEAQGAGSRNGNRRCRAGAMLSGHASGISMTW